MHNFVYLAEVHEPLVKHQKNLGVCLQSCQVIEYKYLAHNLYLIQFRNVFCN